MLICIFSLGCEFISGLSCESTLVCTDVITLLFLYLYYLFCFFQLYLESVQDLLAPEKTNIPIMEDSKTGEVSLPNASVVKVRDLDHCLELLEIGEANRHAANTKLNTESSRSHAILMVGNLVLFN